MDFSYNKGLTPMSIKILGGRFGAASQTALPIQPIWPIFVINGLDWQCRLTGTSRTAPGISIFSIAMGADYSFEARTTDIEIWVPTFFKHKNSSVVIVYNHKNSSI